MITLPPSTCDVLVIGAGPAGAVSAYLLAKMGWHVVLVERCAWPRTKVCGGCMNAKAISLLRSIGIELAGGQAIDSCTIRHGDRSVSFPLTPGLAIERDVLDATLVDAAVNAGVCFFDRCSARIQPADGARQSATLVHDGREQAISFRWALACDGIGGSSLNGLDWAATTVRADSHIGVATTIPAGPSDVPTGAIRMTVGKTGYVGQVRYAQSDRRHPACTNQNQAHAKRPQSDVLHVAAALDPHACQLAGSPGSLVTLILNNPTMRMARWTGVGRLTRHRARCAGDFTLVVGDARGYVEPFTGEGIAWAIAGAIDAAAIIQETRHAPAQTAARWQAWCDARTPGRQRMCRAVRWGLRHPLLLDSSLAALSLWPTIGRRVTRPDSSRRRSPIGVAPAQHQDTSEPTLPRGRLAAAQ